MLAIRCCCDADLDKFRFRTCDRYMYTRTGQFLYWSGNSFRVYVFSIRVFIRVHCLGDPKMIHKESSDNSPGTHHRFQTSRQCSGEAGGLCRRRYFFVVLGKMRCPQSHLRTVPELCGSFPFIRCRRVKSDFNTMILEVQSLVIHRKQSIVVQYCTKSLRLIM